VASMRCFAVKIVRAGYSCRRTINITGAAPVSFNMEQDRHRRVQCMCSLGSAPRSGNRSSR
jgi:hypothetical protein